ncbi:hypothetical protein Vretimale_9642 [Volvox reticuliferus]|uniref:Uncharacterized protein n=1 Tax=Volvox reticuliferus TaxID=1737510 RepID=A0A8J4GDR1_9CHLO|nr:hypothetical protein Vretifemale_19203 [Volvox reticuliferus]GIM05205.1 hypothetical protein Vretimale_9642 [Volvox reticuliferus]
MNSHASALAVECKTEAKLSVAFEPSSFGVYVAVGAQINSKRTFEKITQDIEGQMGVERAALRDVRLKRKTSVGTIAPLSSDSPMGQIVGEFVKAGNSLVIDIPETAAGNISRISRLEQDLAELKSTVKRMQEDNAQMKEDNARMKQNFEDRLAALEEDSARYKDIIKRHVVSEVHESLQQEFGVKEEDQQWDNYLAFVFCQNTDWFKKYDLKLKDLVLMEKGGGSAFQKGNKAAHKPSLVTIKRHVDDLAKEDPAWASWWKVVRDIRRI